MTRLKKASPRSHAVPADPAAAPSAEAAMASLDEAALPAAPIDESESLTAADAIPPPPQSERALAAEIEPARLLPRLHLRGLIESLVFASDKPMTTHELAKLASAPLKDVRELLGELSQTYADRGIVLREVAGGWLFRTSAQFAPFVRDLTSERPVRLSRAQLETLAIAAYRQPITRPEIDEIRGVESGATLKLLLERDLLRILGKKDEPGRPLLYGTTSQFLEFFGLKSLKELPTLREFAELSDESRAVAEAELGDVVPEARAEAARAVTVADEPPAGDEATAGPSVAVGFDESRPAGDDEPSPDAATLADVNESSSSDETAITDPDRVLGDD